MQKTDIDFSKSVIYKFVCRDIKVTDSYVGSTTCFSKRETHHKSSCTNKNSIYYDQLLYQTIRKNGGGIITN